MKLSSRSTVEQRSTSKKEKNDTTLLVVNHSSELRVTMKSKDYEMTYYDESENQQSQN